MSARTVTVALTVDEAHALEVLDDALTKAEDTEDCASCAGTGTVYDDGDPSVGLPPDESRCDSCDGTGLVPALPPKPEAPEAPEAPDELDIPF